MPDSDELKKYESTVVLPDGSTLRLRPIRHGDEDLLLALFDRLSRHTVYLRFHHALPRLSREEAHRLCTVDYSDSFALVGTTGEDAGEIIIAVARYYRLSGTDRAETAFTVEDSYQGKGIGTQLLLKLAAIAREKGIRVFEADVLEGNRNMIEVFENSGFYTLEKLESGVARLVMDITEED